MTMSRELLSKNECTVLKGIAILTVILSHTCGVCHLFDGIPVIGNEQICSALCEAGMPLFLFVSGYGLHISFQHHGMQGYWKKRFISVLIPYMAVQAVTMFIYFIIHGADHSLIYNVSVLLGVNASNSYDPTMWYISYAFFWYLIFYISYMAGHGGLISVFITGTVSFMGFLYVPFYWGNNADYCILTFFAGVLAAWFYSSHIRNTECIAQDNIETDDPASEHGSAHSRLLILFTPLSALLLAAVGYTLMIKYHRLNIITENLGSLAAGAAFVILVKLLHKIYAFHILSFIGSISFPLYLLEWKLIITPGLYDILPDIPALKYITYGVCFALTLVLSLLLNMAFRQLTSVTAGHSSSKINEE